MSDLDKKADAALEAIVALRKHSEAVEDTVKKLLLEVRGDAGNSQVVVETNGVESSTDGISLPTPESAKAALTTQRTRRKTSIFERLAESSNDNSGNRLRIESKEGYVSHLTHGSTHQNWAVAESGRRPSGAAS